MDSSGLMRWGHGGHGQWITVYANSGHAFMKVAGLRFDTSMTAGEAPAGASTCARAAATPSATRVVTKRRVASRPRIRRLVSGPAREPRPPVGAFGIGSHDWTNRPTSAVAGRSRAGAVSLPSASSGGDCPHAGYSPSGSSYSFITGRGALGAPFEWRKLQPSPLTTGSMGGPEASAAPAGKAAAEPPDVRLAGVRKAYGDVVAVAGIDLGSRAGSSSPCSGRRAPARRRRCG